MSKMSAEGSIPSGRAAPLTEENQVVTPSVTGQESSAWSGLGPEVGDRVEVFTESGAADGLPRWVGATVVGIVGGDSDRFVMQADCADPGRWFYGYSISHPGMKRWRWPEGGDPGVTHGKNGVSELPAMPDPERLPEPRRCKGAPGCSCDAVLGPMSEVPGDLCAHCENLTREIDRQTEAAEEPFMDCDLCLPDRLPRSGKVCGRCRASRKAFGRHVERMCSQAARGACASLRTLVRVDYVTADEAQGVQSAIDMILRVVAAELGVMSPRQEVLAAVVLGDAVTEIVNVRREPAASVLDAKVRP